MTSWNALTQELEEWAAEGRVATMWWRDDDATRATPALERLLGIARSASVPICLAVIPKTAQSDLRDLIDKAPDVSVAVHGVTHENFAEPGEKKCELANHLPPDRLASQVAEGLELLVAMAGNRVVPVLVPPWNRIAQALIPLLPAKGYRGLSTYGERPDAIPTPGLMQVNCHVDPIDWRGERGFVGWKAALDALIRHLERRRRGHADPEEPTGLLTHHAVWDEEAFVFLEQLLALTRHHSAARWLGPNDVFGLAL